jgi:hypothetical protein
MKKDVEIFIDKLTNSIEEVATSSSYLTEVVLISKEEINRVHKKDGWLFNWKQEFKQEGHTIYKLVVEGDVITQGLVSIELIHDQRYIEMHLIESAPHNMGHNKKFAGVAANLVAFCCKMSFELGFDGYVAFTAKTQLIDHYAQTLGAQLIYGHNRMAIATNSAKKLVNSYYKEFFNEE